MHGPMACYTNISDTKSQIASLVSYPEWLRNLQLELLLFSFSVWSIVALVMLGCLSLL